MGAAVWLEVLVVWSFLYLALRRVLELLVLCWRSAEAKEVELLVLRHQLAILPPPARSRWSVLVVTPQTLRRWHRRIVRRHWTDPAPARGRPPLPDSVQTVIVRLATENPRWGDQRIRGELLPLGRWASGSSIAGSCAPRPPAGTSSSCRVKDLGGLLPEYERSMTTGQLPAPHARRSGRPKTPSSRRPGVAGEGQGSAAAETWVGLAEG
jgi:hypothetical protein